ncbi:MAG: TolC family protein [Deltaproteobacteria bacterium]|nr:TolC family protein [Deltaproteobacteria bacterium]
MRRRSIIAIVCCVALMLPCGCITAETRSREHRENMLRNRILPPKPHVTQPAPIPKRPISLQEAVEIALKNNHTLREALEDTGIAGDEKDMARALFLPVVSAGYAYHRSDRQNAALIAPDDPRVPPFIMSSEEFRTAEVKLMMTIWDFGRSLGTYNQAMLGQEISGLVYDRTRQRVILNVVMAYFDVLRARRGRIIAEESLAQANEHLKTAISFEKYGVVDMNDVLRAKVQAAEVKQMVIKAKNAVELAVSRLNSVLGVNVNSPTRVIDDTRIIPFSLSLKDCLRLAIEHRPEFEIVQKSIRIEEEGISTVRAGYLPRIYLAGGYNWDDDDHVRYADSSGGLHRSNISGMIGIKIDLFSGGKTTAEMRRARKRLAKSEEKAKEVCDGISLQVKAAFLAVHEARERIKVTEQAMVQAEENLRLMNNKYRENVVTSIDVVDAETLLTRSKQNYYTALYDYIVSLARLENATGAGLNGKKAAADNAGRHK